MHIGGNKTNLPDVKKIIGVLSGKGGVGKTFIACNLALSLAKLGARVGLLDADVYCPNVYKMLGIKTKLVVNPDSKIAPIEKWGIKVISMAGLSSTDDEPVAWRGPIISKIISQLMKESMWGEIDFLVVDFPTGTGDIALTILQNFNVDGVIIATTPQELSVIDARKSANLAIGLKVPLIGVVENMRGDFFGEGGGSRLADTLGTSFLGSIPMRKPIIGACDQGNPPVFQMEELDMIFSKISRAISQGFMV